MQHTEILRDLPFSSQREMLDKCSGLENLVFFFFGDYTSLVFHTVNKMNTSRFLALNEEHFWHPVLSTRLSLSSSDHCSDSWYMVIGTQYWKGTAGISKQNEICAACQHIPPAVSANKQVLLRIFWFVITFHSWHFMDLNGSPNSCSLSLLYVCVLWLPGSSSLFVFSYLPALMRKGTSASMTELVD